MMFLRHIVPSQVFSAVSGAKKPERGKSIFILTVAAAFLFLSVVSIQAQNMDVSKLKYDLSATGTGIVIEGLAPNAGTVKTLYLPSQIENTPVTEIAPGAFANCDSLLVVFIPNSVTAIGARAFADCDSLVSVTLPVNLTAISAGTFFNCHSLVAMTIPETIVSIDNQAFSGCTSLQSISLPSHPISYGYSVFSDTNLNITSKKALRKSGYTDSL
jgi:hypothetical protein